MPTATWRRFRQISFGAYKELSAYSAESIRQQTGIVMQENFIFSDTILNNIILGEPFDQKRLDKAIDLACLSDYVYFGHVHFACNRNQ